MTSRPTRDAPPGGRRGALTVPLAAQADWKPAADRPDPVALLEEQATTRIPELVPVRYGRMAVSPFTFYRGAALPMAADLAPAPHSGIIVQLCGDAHLSNFGLFASPERDLVFDINDFDETLPGPFEWDLKRLAASLVVAGAVAGLHAHAGRHAVHRAVRDVPRRGWPSYAAMRAIDVYYARVDAAAILAFVDKRARPMIESTVKSAAHHDALHELPKLTAVDATASAGSWTARRSSSTGPTSRPGDRDAVIDEYRDSLQEDRRVLLDRYADRRRRAQGRRGRQRRPRRLRRAASTAARDDDPLFLQVKQAEASVYERFLAPERPADARRAGRRRPATAAGRERHPARLGRRRPLGRQLYVRQLQDQKGSAVVEAMTRRRPRDVGRAVRLGARPWPRAVG